MTSTINGGDLHLTFNDLAAARQCLLDAGCTHHRGPHDVGDGTGRKIAQITDPFGNVIGLEGF